MESCCPNSGEKQFSLAPGLQEHKIFREEGADKEAKGSWA